MVVYLKEMTSKFVLTFDIEYDKDRIIQFSGILLQRVSEDQPLYQVKSNINTYIRKNSVSRTVEELTNLSADYLNDYGVSLKEFQKEIDTLLKGIEPKDLVCVSYGIQQDSLILEKNGVDFDQYTHLCAYNLARSMLERKTNLTLTDVAEEAGFAYIQMHNAYFDALATLWTLSYLLEMKGV